MCLYSIQYAYDVKERLLIDYNEYTDLPHNSNGKRFSAKTMDGIASPKTGTFKQKLSQVFKKKRSSIRDLFESFKNTARQWRSGDNGHPKQQHINTSLPAPHRTKTEKTERHHEKDRSSSLQSQEKTEHFYALEGRIQAEMYSQLSGGDSRTSLATLPVYTPEYTTYPLKSGRVL